MIMTDIYDFLKQNAIHFERFDHPPVYTVAEANRLKPPMPGRATKNLFLKDKKGDRHFLLVCEDAKTLDLKRLAASIGVSHLSLASAERLAKYLGIEAGAVSLLALINDVGLHVEVLIDKDLWSAESVQCHPLVNTTTLIISLEDVRVFIKATGHRFRLIDIPE